MPNSASLCHNDSSFSLWLLFDYYLIINYGKEGICSTELHVAGLEANRLTVTEDLFLLLRIFVGYFYFFHLFLQFLAFTIIFFSSKCYLIGLSAESWNIMTLKVVKATVLMVRSFNENWPTKISTMTMKWKLSDKASQWNLRLVMYSLVLYVILEIKFIPGSCDATINAYLGQTFLLKPSIGIHCS